MAVVTFTLADITGKALPATVQPEVVFTPSVPAITIDGIAISTYPVTYKPNSAGAVTANLIATDAVAETDFHYQMQIRWLEPDAYGKSGYGVVDFPEWKIRVPPDGGSLADLIDTPPSQFKAEAIWTGPTTPPAGFVHWFDNSGEFLVYKKWSA